MRNDIEKLFFDDIREKRKTASGSFHKKGKGVISKSKAALKTPSYFMKPKDKRNLNGKVFIYNMYEMLIGKQDFEGLEQEKQKAYMTKWRDLYSNYKIMESLEIKSPGVFQALLVKLDIPKKQKRAANIIREKPLQARKVSAKVEEKTLVTVEPKKPDITILSGLNLNYNGVYNSDQISKILTKLQLLVDGEENSFILNITLQERT